VVGKTISGYRIERHIGAGGMGAVYAAREERSGRRVALKFLLAAPGDAHYAEARARFAREAEVLQQLRHENIVAIIESGEHGTQPFLAMEFVDAPSLRDLQRMSRLFTLDEVGHIGFQLLSGLALCHEKGVVHRDIKPANILVRPGDKVLLVDFGIARLESQPGLTLTGDVFGTPAYMAPEQTQGDPVTPAADVWSVAVVLYELLTGRLPFADPNPLALMNGIRHVAHVDPGVLRPQLAGPLDGLFRVALAKSPAARFPEADGSPARAPATAFQKALLLAIEGTKHPGQGDWQAPLSSLLGPALPPVPASAPSAKRAPAAAAAPLLSFGQQWHLESLHLSLQAAHREAEAAQDKLTRFQPWERKPARPRKDWRMFLLFGCLPVAALAAAFMWIIMRPYGTAPMLVFCGLLLAAPLLAALGMIRTAYVQGTRFREASRQDIEELTELQTATRGLQERRDRLRQEYTSACQRLGIPPKQP
jgi:serine/threonine protein kinase